VRDNLVVLEVGLNESTSRAVNPNIPYTVDEVVDDAVACAEEGAAIVHFHARYDDGGQAWSDAGIYRAVMEGIARKSPLLTYASYFGDLSHIWELSDEPPEGAPLEIACFDVLQEVGGSMEAAVYWDTARREFEPVRYREDAPTEVVRPPALAEFERRGLRPEVDVTDMGPARWAGLATVAGFFEQPLDLRLYLCGRRVVGPVPVPAAIDSYLAQLPDEIDAECTVVGYGIEDARQYEALLRGALARGLNIRVGIGDCPYAVPGATNRELVAWAAAMVAEAGLELATPSDLRERLGLAPR
jgi:uncharacterized protein (DUF849 family)